MIKNIKHLKQGIFELTNWQDSSMPEFKKFNLIYGWNGTGKTTLANAFYTLENPTNTNLSVDWVDGKSKIIRVFNKKFVEENIFKLDSFDNIISPIYVLGAEKVHIQHQIDRLKKYWKDKLERAKKSHQKSDPESRFDEFCVQTAKIIKESLRGGVNNRFNDYDKKKLKEDILKLTPNQTLLSEEQKNKLLTSTKFTKLEKINELNFEIRLTQEEIDKTLNILKETASANFIDVLLRDPKAGQWVGAGLELHHDKEICCFCDNSISEERRKKLNEHFNDAVSQLKGKIEQEKMRLEVLKTNLERVQLPKNAEFYPNLIEEYQPNILESIIKEYINQIDTLIGLLINKLNFFHEPLINSLDISTIDGSTALEAINKLIQMHNEKTDNLDQYIRDSREQYATAILVENSKMYKEHQETIEAYNIKLERYNKIIKTIDDKVMQLTTEIRNHRTPAEIINQQLEKYLGHNELQFAVKENGYEIHRKNQSTQHESLCESERTAIALIFFLNSLCDENFKLENGVVVLDDPISSLDNKSLFTAFTFIKEHIKKAHQFFILTHNFEFMNQVKRWLVSRYTNQKNNAGNLKPDKAAFFMLLHRFDNMGRRYSNLIEMDRLIKNYNSEYHYNFKMIYQCSRSETLSLTEYMPIPNLLRKLIETFAAFQFPSKNSNHLEIFEEDDIERGKIERFLNVLSHADSMSLLETMSDHYLQDTKQICKKVLDKISCHNKNHYDEMIKLVDTL